MYKEIKLTDAKGAEEITVPMLATATTTYRYKQIFGVDFMRTDALENIENMLNLAPQLAFVMAKQAARADMTQQNTDTFLEWAEGFDSSTFTEHAGEILGVWMNSKKAGAKSKK